MTMNSFRSKTKGVKFGDRLRPCICSAARIAALCRVEKMFYSRMISANNSVQSEYTENDIGISIELAKESGLMGGISTAAAHVATKKWLADEATARQNLSEIKASLEERQRVLTV